MFGLSGANQEFGMTVFTVRSDVTKKATGKVRCCIVFAFACGPTPSGGNIQRATAILESHRQHTILGIPDTAKTFCKIIRLGLRNAGVPGSNGTSAWRVEYRAENILRKSWPRHNQQGQRNCNHNGPFWTVHIVISFEFSVADMNCPTLQLLNWNNQNLRP